MAAIMTAAPTPPPPSTSNPINGGEYDARATIIIIGMKGAGKTTIGLMANRTMGRTFIDTDHNFRMSQNTSVESYVAAHGWHAFRAKETSILKDLLNNHPYDAVIACGGGIIESSESRRLLKSVMHTMPVIRVLREEQAIRKYIDGRWLRQYDEDLEAMMRRRALLYRECCSHTFYNLTCDSLETMTIQGPSNVQFADPLKFKQMGNSFERLLRAILGNSFKQQANHSNTFADPELGANSIQDNHSTNLHARQSPSRDMLGTPPTEYNTPPVLRSSISNLLAPHGPGPMPEVAIGSPTSNDNKIQAQRVNMVVKQSMPPRKGSNGTYGFGGKVDVPAILPCRANTLDRSSLLTRRTTAMSLTFADLTNVDAGMIKNITQGVDALELRVDMLDCIRPATATARSTNLEAEPMIDFEEVARQLETLRKMTPDIPILFTLRSDREGGFFHDDRKLSQRDTRSPHSQAIYFKLLTLAIGTGVEMLDVELGWDPWMTKRLIESRGRTKIVLSYHDLMGALKWDSGVARQLYDRACSFGDGVHVVMMIGTTTRVNIEQNQHLGSFSARILAAAGADPTKQMPPLMALNMGLAGRSSRPFNDVLNFVSHPAMPMKAGKGQLSLKEMMETLVRLSMIRTSHFHLYGDVYQSAQLVKKAISAAFDEFGLPFTLLDEGTWSLTEYVEAHQKDDFAEREEEEKAMINSISDGLFIAEHAHRQVELYEIMLKRCPNRITKVGKIVQAVDVMARQDVALALLGTERGRHVPNSLGDIRGPLIGCHTLPDAIERTLSSHLAPINAPNVHRTGLIIVLNDEGNESEERDIDMDSDTNSKQSHASTTISKRSALYALAKLGLGTIFIVEQNDPNPQHQTLDETPFSRRPSVTPSTSRESSVQPGILTKSWSDEVVQLIQTGTMADRTVETISNNDEMGNIHKKRKLNTKPSSRSNRITIKNISLSSLAQSSLRSGHETPDHGAIVAAQGTQKNGGISEMHFNHDDEDAETMAALQDFEKHPSKRPCAIVVVGGSEEKQKECLSSLPSSIAVKKSASKSSSTQNGETFVIPEELWRSSFGGTIVRIPSKRTEIIGSRSKSDQLNIQKVNGNPDFWDDQTATLHDGWVLVEPWVIERNRVQRNVIEAWTRRSAPSNHLRSIWDSI